jgi:hypothetical protein
MRLKKNNKKANKIDNDLSNWEKDLIHWIQNNPLVFLGAYLFALIKKTNSLILK